MKVGRPRERRSGRPAERQPERENEKARGFRTVDDDGRGWGRKGNGNDDQYFATPRATTYSVGAKPDFSDHFVSRSRMETILDMSCCSWRYGFSKFSAIRIHWSRAFYEQEFSPFGRSRALSPLSQLASYELPKHPPSDSLSFTVYTFSSQPSTLTDTSSSYFLENHQLVATKLLFSFVPREYEIGTNDHICDETVRKWLGTHDLVPRGHDTGVCENTRWQHATVK